MMTNVIRQVPHLPASIGDLERKSLRSKSLNDYVEDGFTPLFDSSEEFRELLEPVTNADGVEGATVADDIKAAEMIRDAAPEMSPIKRKNLWAIRHALLVVMRRWQISRRERARLLGGTIVP